MQRLCFHWQSVRTSISPRFPRSTVTNEPFLHINHDEIQHHQNTNERVKSRPRDRPSTPEIQILELNEPRRPPRRFHQWKKRKQEKGGGAAPETKRLGDGSALGRAAGAFGGAKAETENMRRNPDLATAAAIAAGNLVPRDWRWD